jgi:hypothetical protein
MSTYLYVSVVASWLKRGIKKASNQLLSIPAAKLKLRGDCQGRDDKAVQCPVKL